MKSNEGALRPRNGRSAPFGALGERHGGRKESCKYSVRENYSDYTSDYKRQKSEFQICIATMESEVQKF